MTWMVNGCQGAPKLLVILGAGISTSYLALAQGYSTSNWACIGAVIVNPPTYMSTSYGNFQCSDKLHEYAKHWTHSVEQISWETDRSRRVPKRISRFEYLVPYETSKDYICTKTLNNQRITYLNPKLADSHLSTSKWGLVFSTWPPIPFSRVTPD